jgi:hypothetical protein
MPMSSNMPGGLCPTCARLPSQVAQGRFCRACGKPIHKHTSYVEIEGTGLYCQDCYQNRAPCDVCGAPQTDERWQLSDGRISCAHCHATAVYTPPEAVELYEQMKTAAAQSLGLTLNVPTGLALVDRTQLAEIIHQQVEVSPPLPDAEPIDPERTLGIYTRRGLRRGIYVQNGLPRSLLLQVAAHEFAHAWQGENCPLLQNSLVREGFAEWVAYTLLGEFGQKQMQQRMHSRPDLYGQGLRWALNVAAQDGAVGVIQACRVSN